VILATKGVSEPAIPPRSGGPLPHADGATWSRSENTNPPARARSPHEPGTATRTRPGAGTRRQRWNSDSLSRYWARREIASARVKPSSSAISTITELSS